MFDLTDAENLANFWLEGKDPLISPPSIELGSATLEIDRFDSEDLAEELTVKTIAADSYEEDIVTGKMPQVANAAADDRIVYVATNGSDRNIGTIDSPFATIQRAHREIDAGDTIYIRGGTYNLPKDKTISLSKNGTADAPIRLFAYNNEKVILNAERWSRVDAEGNNIRAIVEHTGDYWHVKGINVTGGSWLGYFAFKTSNNIWENLDIYRNDNTGFVLYGAGSKNNLILNSDFHHNYDPLEYGEDADGLAIKFGSGTGNIIRGCRSFANSDDGFDFWEFKSPVTIQRSWGFNNGIDIWGAGTNFAGDGNGFKLGGGEIPPPVAHVVRRSLAWNNASSGFDENGNSGAIEFYHNTAFDNGDENFYLPTGKHLLRNNLSVSLAGNGAGVVIGDLANDNGNSWTLPVTVDRNDFISLNSSIAKGNRTQNNKLPVSNFLRLRSNSDLIDRGIDLGKPFQQIAPDLGAFEYL
jgi:hypothetical protein